jgi:hypothetical protein
MDIPCANGMSSLLSSSVKTAAGRRPYSSFNLVMICNSVSLAVPVPSGALMRASGVGSKQDITA